MQKHRRVGLLVAAGVWLGAVGCGVPDAKPEPLGVRGAGMTGDGPDLVVTSVSGPANLRPGESFMATVTVCNQGTQYAIADAELYLSRDAVITPGGVEPGDYSLGGVHLGWLEPGACATRELEGYWQEEGDWYLGAYVDPYQSQVELQEDNNAHTGAKLVVGFGPDFVVTKVSGPANVRPGESFTATVMVCNRGTQYADADVKLYLSQDAVITPDGAEPGDYSLGEVYMNGLGPGGCAMRAVRASTSVPEGLWYLGAYVDPYQGRVELQEDNNAHTGAKLGVGHGPDLVVTSVSGPANVMPGESFTATVTVCNQGTMGTTADVKLYLSRDAVITPDGAEPGDYSLGEVYMDELGPGGCATREVRTSTWVPDGLWYLGAYVDAYQSRVELQEDNNAHTGAKLGVGYAPDFVVTKVSGPANVRPGEAFTVMVTVCNQGTGGGDIEVELYQSQGPVIAPFGDMPGDHSLGMTYVSWLDPGGCATREVQVSINWVYGDSWYLGAYADPYKSRMELRKDNNAHTGAKRGVGYAPDFVVTSLSGPANMRPGESLTANVTVCNQGTQGADAYAWLVLSQDAIINPEAQGHEDYYLGVESIGWLEPGQCATRELQRSTTWVTKGLWYLGAYADPYVNDELQEDNNAYTGARLGVGHGPDFVVTGVSGPASVTPGGAFTVNVTVCNQGTQGEDTDVELYLSEDAVVTPGPTSGDFSLGKARVGWLEPGQCATQSLPVTANGPQGALYLGAYVDPFQDRMELQEENNAHTGGSIGVGNGPDFVVTEVSGPTHVQRWDPLPLTVTVCNQGTQGADTDVELYLSGDAVLNPYNGMSMGDWPVGRAPTGFLAPGQCISLSISGFADDGIYYLGAYVDPHLGRVELIESNNDRVGPLVFVQP